MVERIEKINKKKQAVSVRTYDFSTLYTKVHSKSLEIYFKNRNNFYMVQYFYQIFSTGIESELLSIFRYKLYKNIVFKVAKLGPKILNFQSFDLNKGKIIPQCSLKLDRYKGVYLSKRSHHGVKYSYIFVMRSIFREL